MIKILLNKKASKTSKNVNNILATQLKGSKKLLPQSRLLTTINEMEVYNAERANCNLIRLNCVINPVCSNVLFNSCTEIVKNEGDPNTVQLLNYGRVEGYVDNDDFDETIYCKTPLTFINGGSREAIRDTQISSIKCGYKYNCGIDIFNNHILRNNTFKTVCYSEMKNAEFNTLFDWMRDENGLFIQGFGFSDKNKDKAEKLEKQHLYTLDDINSYDDTINNKLIEKNGWFGFSNTGKFSVVDNNNETMDIFRVINYKRSCDFIQMYPSSDLWSFTPKYNPYLHRLEKNWNYCLTYPSSSTTKNITFIRENTNSLKIMYINDNVTLKNGLNGIKIYSISKHGLKRGDYINLYQNDDVVLPSREVIEVYDEYTFSIFSSGSKLINDWYELTKQDTDTNGVDDFVLDKTIPLETFSYKVGANIYSGLTFTSSSGNISMSDVLIQSGETINFHGIKYISSETNKEEIIDGVKYQHITSYDFIFELQQTEINKNTYQYELINPSIRTKVQYIISTDRNKIYCGYGDDRIIYYTIDHKYVNIDDNAQDFSFKRVIDNSEVDYYVRIFSKIPNWKGCDVKIDKNKLYGDKNNLIAKYQTSEHDFENHISKLSFAKNIYGDDLTQIVFTDDIDISYLKDNLGRPLTSIYLTILKNNKGYKEWYGKNGVQIDIRKSTNDDEKKYLIEYSHCFGMLNCAFRLSKESLPNIYHNNSAQINNLDSSFQYQGLDVEDLQHTKLIYEDILNNEMIVDNENDDAQTLNRSYRSNFKEILNDEIQYGEYVDKNNNKYLGDTHFYGDLCAYSKVSLVEEPIQQIEMRFNTAQRELSSLDNSYGYFKNLYYDELISDDKNPEGFIVEENEILNAHQHKEGYCYYPHYEIQIKTFGDTVHERSSIMMTMNKIDSVLHDGEKNISYKIKTLNNHNVQLHDKLYLRHDIKNTSTNVIISTKYYECYVTDIINNKIFECSIFNENGVRVNTLNTIDILPYKLFKKDLTTPDYASLTYDGSCHFMWREIFNNGFNDNVELENYPFLNGSFYVNKNINLFVRRQDPKEESLLQSNNFINDISPNMQKKLEDDNYSTESNIVC